MMNEIQLKYGCNPNQKPSRIFMEDGSGLPVTVLNGKPGYINFLDAFNGWQLVKELKQATGLPAATSFKHVSPAGAAVGLPLTDTLAKIYWVDDLGDLSPLACAYARARGADRMSSFGDFIALSDVCDAGQKADNWYLRQAPQVLGLQFIDKLGRADRDNAIDVYIGEEYEDVLREGEWQQRFKVKPPVFTREEKRAWLDGNQNVTLGSDAFFPFSDNIERAHKSGVKYIAQPGGSVRDDLVIECCDKYQMVMAFTGIRLFHH